MGKINLKNQTAPETPASGKTVIFVSHNMDLVAALADRILVLEEGKITYDGPRQELFANDDILNRAALKKPQVFAFMQSLIEKGISVQADIYTITDAKDEIAKVLRS